MSLDIKTYNNLYDMIYKNNIIGGEIEECVYYGYGFPNICILNKQEKPKNMVSVRQFSIDNIVSISDILSKNNYNKSQEVSMVKKKSKKVSLAKKKSKKSKKIK